MIRIVIQQLLLFIAPFLVYFLYRLLASRGEGFLQDAPWYALAMTGGVLSVVALIALGFHDDDANQGVYVPPHMEDGRIVPGQVNRPGDG